MAHTLEEKKKLLNRVRDSPDLGQPDPEVGKCLGKIWIQPHRLPVMTDRLGGASGLRQCVREIIMGIRRIGIEFQRPPELVNVWIACR